MYTSGFRFTYGLANPHVGINKFTTHNISLANRLVGAKLIFEAAVLVSVFVESAVFSASVVTIEVHLCNPGNMKIMFLNFVFVDN